MPVRQGKRELGGFCLDRAAREALEARVLNSKTQLRVTWSESSSVTKFVLRAFCMPGTV